MVDLPFDSLKSDKTDSLEQSSRKLLPEDSVRRLHQAGFSEKQGLMQGKSFAEGHPAKEWGPHPTCDSHTARWPHHAHWFLL